MGESYKEAMTKMLIDHFIDGKQVYATEVIGHIIDKASYENHKMTLAVTARAIELLTEPFPSAEELSDTIIVVYENSHILYLEKSNESSDTLANAMALMCQDIVAHFNK